MTAPVGKDTVTFNSRALRERDILISHLLKNPAILGNEFRFLEPCFPDNSEFLVGANQEKRLQLVEGVILFDEGLLYRALSHLKWIVRNVLKQAKDSGRLQFNPSLMPGIIFVAPACPRDFIDTFDFISGDIPIRVITYAYLESEHERGFCFNPMDIPRAATPAPGKQPVDDQIAYFREQIGLTREEIMQFLS